MQNNTHKIFFPDIFSNIKLSKCFVALFGLIVILCSFFDNLKIVHADEKSNNVITLRICNWEEYIDDSIISDFENWYYKKTNQKVKVEYSCFGTNEELYNYLTMGDSYDCVCPSEYMIMKLMAEDMLVPYSDSFFDTNIDENYYIRNVSPYIKNIFDSNEINNEKWSKYAAGYMWGVTGTVYNPKLVDENDVSTFNFYKNTKYAGKITLKDNVRDSYFVALGALYSDKLKSNEFVQSEDYSGRLAAVMNDTDEETIEKSQKLLHEMVENTYSLETDSGKADMVSGKVVANYQWSGDAVYSMDQAEEDGLYLDFAIPDECTNMWFDGWVMLKNAINGDDRKQAAAEGFINFVSRPDNAVKNMYYIGYTSAIAGNESDDTIYQYLIQCYGDENGDVSYPVGYFFSGDNDDEKYMLRTSKEQTHRQLFAQYPPFDVMERSAIMQYFDKEQNKNINQMWIDIRCFDIKKTPIYAWVVVGATVIAAAILFHRKVRSMK